VIAAAGGPPDGRRPSLFDTPEDRRLAALAWIAALAASFLLLALFQFRSGDPDSNVYAGISARLAAEPFVRWIAPEWWGQWDFTGPFREHPIGIFVLPALAGRLGYPPPQAAYAVHGLFQAVSIVLVQLIAVQLVSRRDARALGWIVQLMPIAFVFRIRANQEYAVLAGILLALLATERSRARPAWAWLTALGFAWALLVKGVFGFLVPIACGVWLVAAEWSDRAGAGAGRSGKNGASRRAVPWVALTSVLLVAPILTVTYEWAYRAVTGDSFLAFYTGPRLRPDAVAGGAIDRAGYNIVWYTARLVWYAFPWSVVALAAFGMWVLGARNRREMVSSADEGAVRALAFATVASFILIVLFSFSDRRADRFIFPAYYFMAAAGGIVAIRSSPALSRVANRLDRPWIPAACWMALFLLRLGTGSHLPQFTFWRS
jgi:4-amino-4-deoxy-L-arabinose transferase-like glycosyltransferase